MTTAVVLLAAGQGTRMKSALPKVLHRLAGATLLEHAMAPTRSIAPDRVIVVTGNGADAVGQVAQHLDPDVRIVHQAERRGTGHAVQQAAAALEGFTGDVVVLYGDTPFIRPETLQAMLDARRGGAAVVVLGFEATEPGAYGRLIAAPDGTLEAIVEAQDASPEVLAVTLCNCGVVAADCTTLLNLLGEARDDNAKREINLTDVVSLARAHGLRSAAITCTEAEALGINSRADLAAAEAVFQNAARAAAMENGATLTDPATVWFSRDTVLGRDVIVEPNVFFGPRVRIESDVLIHSFSHLENCHVRSGAEIGPFARLRPGAEVAEGCKIGNFVEIKNSTVAGGAKINHFSYIGDASVGSQANIGAGTIVCNYDGVFKHRTEIGARAFIGSNSALVAPVRIGSEAMVAAGSVITRDVPDAGLALGRARQSVKAGMGRKLMDRLRALKAGSAAN